MPIARVQVLMTMSEHIWVSPYMKKVSPSDARKTEGTSSLLAAVSCTLDTKNTAATSKSAMMIAPGRKTVRQPKSEIMAPVTTGPSAGPSARHMFPIESTVPICSRGVTFSIVVTMMGTKSPVPIACSNRKVRRSG